MVYPIILMNKQLRDSIFLIITLILIKFSFLSIFYYSEVYY